MLLALLTLTGCDVAAPSRSCDLSAEHLVIAATDPTFRSAGLLAHVPETECTTVLPATVGPDPLVRPIDDHVVLVDRSGPQRAQLFHPGDYASPRTEFAVHPRNANVHDVVQIDGQILLTQYDGAGVAVHDLDGSLKLEVSLGEVADADGFAEPDQLVMWGGRPHVSVQRLTRDGARWTAPQPGQMVPLVPGTWDLGTPIPIGPNPRIARSAAQDRVAVLTGIYGEPDGALLIHESAGTRQLATEEEHQLDFTAAAMTASHVVVLGLSFDWDPVRSTVLCVSLTDGATLVGPTEEAWWIDVVPADEVAYIGARSFGTSDASPAVLTVLPETCELGHVELDRTLHPYSLAWVP